MKNNYYINFIDFFKKHGLYNPKLFKYIHEQSENFSRHELELMNKRGLYYIYNKEDKLVSLKLYTPYIENELTLLMNIRPYIQAIYAYPYLGKKYKQTAESEILAMYFEKLYLQENPNPNLEEYLNNIYTSIEKEETQTIYKIALNAQQELQKYCQKENRDFKSLKRKARTLSIKHTYR